VHRINFFSQYDDKLDCMKTFSETFFEMMLSKYGNLTISLTAVHDYFLSMEQQERHNQQIGIFCKHMSGHEDVLFYYIFLVKKCISENIPGEELDLNQYRKLIEVIYPSRQVDEYETMELEFHSFCKNKMSREKIDEHFMHMIESEIEPNIDLVF
jgi:hypothetical protein